jgi:hypothetical protein
MAGLRFLPLCTIDGVIATPKLVDRGAGLVQENYPVDVTVVGERLNGKMQGESYYDWMSVPGGIGTLRVLAVIETDDGASISVRYESRSDITNGIDNLFGYAAPVFTTTHPEYSWLNLVQAVGRGTIHGDRVHWDWFQLARE